MLRNSLIALCALLLAGLAMPTASSAQFLEELGEAAKDAAEDETRRQVRKAARNAVRCAVGEFECIREAKREGKDVVVTDENGEPVSDEKAAEAIAAAGTANANYDFEAGARTIFASDFADEAIGDFPGELEFQGGNMEVVEWNGERWLRTTNAGKFVVHLDEPLPEKYTISFDAHIASGISDGIQVVPEIPERALHYYQRHYFLLGHRHVSGVKPGGRAEGLPESTTGDDQIAEGPATARIMVDGSKAKVYVNEHRVANIPNADLARSDRILFLVPGRVDDPSFVRNIRIAGEARGPWAELSAEGRVTIQDIAFAEGSATIEPVSAPTLAEIATMLSANPDLQLLIEGHVNGTGGFDADMQLSKARAEAVVGYLVEKHGIAAERLRAMGLGSSQPLAEGDSPEARERNGRIVLVRI